MTWTLQQICLTQEAVWQLLGYTHYQAIDIPFRSLPMAHVIRGRAYQIDMASLEVPSLADQLIRQAGARVRAEMERQIAQAMADPSYQPQIRSRVAEEEAIQTRFQRQQDQMIQQLYDRLIGPVMRDWQDAMDSPRDLPDE